MSLSVSVVPSTAPAMVYWAFWLLLPTCITLHFPVLKDIPHLSAQSTSMFRQSWSTSLSSTDAMILPSFVSSANFLRMSIRAASRSMSLMKMSNSIGPRTLPCGTPDSTAAGSDASPFSTTFCVLSVSQALTHWMTCPPTPCAASLASSHSFGWWRLVAQDFPDMKPCWHGFIRLFSSRWAMSPSLTIDSIILHGIEVSETGL